MCPAGHVLRHYLPSSSPRHYVRVIGLSAAGITYINTPGLLPYYTSAVIKSSYQVQKPRIQGAKELKRREASGVWRFEVEPLRLSSSGDSFLFVGYSPIKTTARFKT